MKAIEKKYLIPFCLITSLFFLWGLANNMTDTLLSAFKKIMSMSDTQTSLIQTAFYGAYFCFALPAALFIRRYSYKTGVLLGLLLYAGGAMLFFPASKVASYAFYLVAIYVLAGGCSILETAANPYIMSMGTQETATRRLNIAQSLNPIGCITGILLSKYFILSELNSANAADREAMADIDLKVVQQHELDAVTGTYMAVGFVLLALMVIVFLVRMPEGGDNSKDLRKRSGCSDLGTCAGCCLTDFCTGFSSGLCSVFGSLRGNTFCSGTNLDRKALDCRDFDCAVVSTEEGSERACSCSCTEDADIVLLLVFFDPGLDLDAGKSEL